MQASLVTAAGIIALAGALFHGVVGGKSIWATSKPVRSCR